MTEPSAARRSGFVAIAGRPNAGKSTLMNRVLKTELSIVSPKAQTTRERVLGILTEPALGQMVFMDTPGIHKAKEGGINEFMVKEARGALESDPSVVWYIVDPDSGLQHEQVVLELLSESRAPIFVLMNKADLSLKPTRQEARSPSSFAEELERAAKEKGLDIRGVFHISAKKGTGVERLLEATWDLLPRGPFFYPDEEQISDRPVRFFVAEKVREQLLRCLGDELPYSCAVQIERFDEKVKPPRIEAIIHVERDSQKGIVIGKGGAKIKEIGQSARREIEKFLGHQVFLGLKVKVLKDWTRDPESMRKLGYVFARKESA